MEDGSMGVNGKRALYIYFCFFLASTVPATKAVNGAVEASPKLPATVLIISEATRLLFRML